jgi:hypothetical protein
MKEIIFVISISFMTACSDKPATIKGISKRSSVDTLIIRDTVFINNENNWQQNFGLTNDPETDSVWRKPVKFYISNPKCSPIAIDFYYGQFRPTDNRTTEALLKLVTADDNHLRPFYRWCLYKTIQIQDGALGEMTGIPARQYAEKFPEEFFEYIDAGNTEVKYQDWVDAIAYSGFYETDDYQKPKDIKNRLATKMKRNCVGCSELTIQRIDNFAKDCFP